MQEKILAILVGQDQQREQGLEDLAVHVNEQNEADSELTADTEKRLSDLL